MKTPIITILVTIGLLLGPIVFINAQSQKDLAKSEFGIKNADLTKTDLDGLLEKDNHVSSVSGIKHSYYRQSYNGIEIFGADASLHTDAANKVIHSNNSLISRLNTKISNATPGLTPKQAIQAVATKMAYGPTNNLQQISTGKTALQKTIFTPGGISLENIPVNLIYMPTDNGIRLAWEMSILELNQANWWHLIVDAQSGEILNKINWIVTCDFGDGHDHSGHTHTIKQRKNKKPTTIDFDGLLFLEEANKSEWVGGYRVYAMPIESPYFGNRTLVTDPDNAIASPYGWHDTNGSNGAEYTITRGNNVHAYEDGNNPGFSPNGGSALTFDFPLNTTYSSSNQSESAVITNLFYWNNIIHDVMYQYGFDEASGNFQQNNYGNGGSGNDYVQAEAQDGSGTCNANFGTPGDGSRPRMQMYVCGAFDGDLDNVVIVHEYGHGISNRLTGGRTNSGCLSNTEQMGEGWSDYYGLMFTMDASNSATSNRTVGTWLFGQGANGPGIRPYPYNTNMSVNPQTYNSIKTAAVPHGVGSVWCTMLWEMTWELIGQHGYSNDIYNGTAGNNIAINLVTEGLKLQPCSPGFVSGRDAILAADQALYGGANQCLIWTAFAKRGLGAGASQGSTSSRSDGTESYSVPSGVCGGTGCIVSASPTQFNYGPNATNGSYAVSSTGSWTVSSNVSWLSPTTTTGSGNGNASFSVSANNSTSARTGTLTINCSGASASVTVTQSGQAACSQSYANLPYSTGFESGLDQYWCISSSTSFGRVEVSTLNGPHSGTRHLTMDVSSDNNFSTNEARLGLNLATVSGATLSFWWKEFNDEDNAEDGIYFSSNGGASFTQVYSLQSAPSAWTKVDLDMNALATANGLTLTSNFVVKFQQRDNYSISTDGFAFDDISVTGTAQNCTVSTSPATINLPFNASSTAFQVTSNGNWSVTDNASWLTAATTSGSGNGTVNINATENTGTGARTATITVTCGTSTSTITVNQAGTPASCSQQYASLPYTTGFESGNLDQYWCTNTENANGRVQVATGNTPRGNYHLTMDVVASGTYSTQEATLGLKLAGKTGVVLDFWWKEFNDENDAQDGVYFSSNGGASYTLVYSLQNGPSAWTNVTLDVNALAASNGLSLTDNFVVKFQQRDNYVIPTDGFAFDDISVSSSTVCSVAVAPTNINAAAAGGSYTATITSNSNWTVTDNASWVTLSTASGSGNGTFSVNIAANTSTVTRSATVTISCGGSTATITVFQAASAPPTGCASRAYAVIPYSTGFESGTLDQYWCSDTENAFGRVQVTNLNAPHSGNNHLTMDVTTNGNYSTQEASLGLQLAGKTGVSLSFWFKEFNDENDVADGVYFSSNGGTNYTKVYDLQNAPAAWTNVTLDVNALATTYGLTLTNNFVVKFQQRDNYSIATDGFAFDDISVTSVASCTVGVTPATVNVGNVAATYGGTVTSNGSWTITSNSSWLTGNPGSGSGNANITYTVTANTASTSRVGVLTVSCGSSSVTITVTQNGAPAGCTQNYASLPYSTGFEAGLDQYWCTESSNNFGRIQVTNANSPHSGSYHLTMDANVNNNFVTNGASLGLKLAGANNVILSWWWKEFNDENHTQDGLYFSDDGGATFTKVYAFQNGPANWTQVNFDVSATAANYGLQLNDNFVIKFQQYDNYSIGTDGFAFDDISVTGQAGACTLSHTTNFTIGSNIVGVGFSISSTGGGTWTATENISWLSLNNTTGGNGDYLYSSTSQNTTGANRTGVINLFCGNFSSTITLTQTTVPNATTGSETASSFGGGDSGVILIEAETIDLSKEVMLTNYPNPFGDITTIEYSLPEASTVNLVIMDIAGKVVARPVVEKEQESGIHTLQFDSADLANGMYFYTLLAGDQRVTKQMLIAK